MDLASVVEATTAGPARAVRRADVLGSLTEGREADVTVLEIARGERSLVDADGERELAEEWLVPRYVVRAGEVLELDPALGSC
jgi:dihydroorotase